MYSDSEFHINSEPELALKTACAFSFISIISASHAFQSFFTNWWLISPKVQIHYNLHFKLHLSAHRKLLKNKPTHEIISYKRPIRKPSIHKWCHHKVIPRSPTTYLNTRVAWQSPRPRFRVTYDRTARIPAGLANPGPQSLLSRQAFRIIQRNPSPRGSGRASITPPVCVTVRSETKREETVFRGARVHGDGERARSQRCKRTVAVVTGKVVGRLAAPCTSTLEGRGTSRGVSGLGRELKFNTCA